MRKITLLALCLAIGCNMATAKEKRNKKTKQIPQQEAAPSVPVPAQAPPPPPPPPPPVQGRVAPPVPVGMSPHDIIPQPQVHQPVPDDHLPVPDARQQVTIGPRLPGAPGDQRKRPLRPMRRNLQPGMPDEAGNLPPGARRVLPQNPPPPNPQIAPPPLPLQPDMVKVSPNAGVFDFSTDTHNFGMLPEGNPVEYDFEFKNSGKEAIVIKEAHASCGCTIPSYPKEPIQPGGSGKIHVIYNTKGRPGVFNKEITITSNARQQPMVLRIGGEVKAQ